MPEVGLRGGNEHAEFIQAAGGVVWRDARRRELAVIYRDHHRPEECCLPKGKLEDGESWEDAAVREVWEEIGCLVRLRGFAGIAHYWVQRQPKVVVYFEMVLEGEGEFRPSDEVRAMQWMPPGEAAEKLTHEDERNVLKRCLVRPPGSGRES